VCGIGKNSANLDADSRATRMLTELNHCARIPGRDGFPVHLPLAVPFSDYVAPSRKFKHERADYAGLVKAREHLETLVSTDRTSDGNPGYDANSLASIESLQSHLQRYARTAGGGTIDGSMTDTNRAVWTEHVIAVFRNAETYCETGFNYGASSALVLSVNPKIKVYAFDIGSGDKLHPAPVTERGIKLLHKIFPGRLTLTFGDSRESIDKFRLENPEVKCDIILVDGGHRLDVPLRDFQSFSQMASDNAVIMADDYGLGTVKDGIRWTVDNKVVDWKTCLTIRRSSTKSYCFGRMVPRNIP
jgi:hypothetical protein